MLRQREVAFTRPAPARRVVRENADEAARANGCDDPASDIEIPECGWLPQGGKEKKMPRPLLSSVYLDLKIEHDHTVVASASSTLPSMSAP